jgi:hypothetical protein
MSVHPTAAKELLPPPLVRRYVESLPAGRKAGPVFFNGDGDIPHRIPASLDVVLPAGDEAHARAWLARGVARVFPGDAALRDSTLVERLATEFPGRIGVYAPARRMGVSWILDSHSNADFRVMTPSVCEPCWEVLTAAGKGTGTHLHWWVGEMFQRGAADVLVRIDTGDDTDINILHGLVEEWGERLWVGPLIDSTPDYASWVAVAGATQLVVTPTVAADHPFLVALEAPPSARKRRRAVS